MLSAYVTAYTRLKSSVSDEELNRSYAPTGADLALATQVLRDRPEDLLPRFAQDFPAARLFRPAA